ncbi:hypothetical protein O181_102021 [Austropuccinia psidii MF-1]|uniref:Uncharacterized protein n=1 Tax=Austropuccinia psidii MF-1 TaxID=1389203 RepID=A0A9Q3JI36_9BASI|nr:hypothetical protein [Austropuccinia psidii MF-1]
MEDYDDILDESTTIAFWMDQDGCIGGNLGTQHSAVMAQIDVAECPGLFRFASIFWLVGCFNKDQSFVIAAKSLVEVRKSPPVYDWRDQFLKVIAEYKGTIFVGDTGSGITSQLSQYDHQAACTNNHRKIGSTPARRVPAMWVSGRVADKMGLRVGDAVGYLVWFEDGTSPKTVIKCMNDRMLLREHMSKPDLAGSINATSNPSTCDSSSISNSNLQKLAPKCSKQQPLPNLNSIHSYLHLNKDMIHNTPIESQPLSNDDSSIGAAFQPHYQMHPSQSLMSSSSCNHLNPSSSSSIN